MDPFNSTLAYGVTAGLLFLVIMCILAYHYLRAQVQHAASEANSIYGLNAEKEKLSIEVGALSEQILLLKTSLGEKEFERLRADKATIEQEYDAKFRALEDAKSELNFIALDIQKAKDLQQTIDQLDGKISQLSAELAELDRAREDAEKKKQEMEASSLLINEMAARKEALDLEIAALNQSINEERQTNSEELKRLQVEHQEALDREKVEMNAAMDAEKQNYLDEKTRNHEALQLAATQIKDLDDQVKERCHALDLLTAREQKILELVGRKSEVNSAEQDTSNLFEAPDIFSSYSGRRSSSPDLDERAELGSFQDALRTSGYYFTARTLRSFHTSLKCNDISPLTVLAGVSGTGKTLLPLKYAEYFGIPSLVVPVQPRWDSHDDLFGSYNYMEQRFVATELARSLMLMDKYNNGDRGRDVKDWSKHMFLVLLDEMNLARTEYYFSEFLSRLELRRGLDPTKDQQRKKSELLTGKDSAKSLWVGPNVLFTGTMNEDESTQTLSDKVLDRSNIIRFAPPSFNPVETSNITTEQKSLERQQLMPVALWEKWIGERSIGDGLHSDIAGALDVVSMAMSKVGRPYGHRLRNSILAYISRYPVKSEKGQKEAFADQIEQRLLPKLRGVQLTDDNRVEFDRMVEVIEKIGDSELSEAIGRCLGSDDLGLFFWNGLSREETD